MRWYPIITNYSYSYPFCEHPPPKMVLGKIYFPTSFTKSSTADLKASTSLAISLRYRPGL